MLLIFPRGCNEFACVANNAADCMSVGQIQLFTQVEMNPTSHCPGNIEAACKMGNSLITDKSCPGTNQNKMAVAISNGDFHFNDPFRY